MGSREVVELVCRPRSQNYAPTALQQTISGIERPTLPGAANIGHLSWPATNGNKRQYRVVVHGLSYFCQKLPQLLQDDRWLVLDRSGHGPRQLIELAKDLARCDLVYTWGGRVSMGKFLWAARLLGTKKIIMLWSGSDVLYAQREHASGLGTPWIRNAVHWAVSPWIAEEVRALGVPCEHVQASFVDLPPEPDPLSRKFSVLLFVNGISKADLYGWDRMLAVAERLRHIQFNLCGLPAGESLPVPSNITLYNWMSDLSPLLKQTTVVYRPVRHDGLSFTVLEALSHGRYVLYSYPLPGCIHVRSVSEACEHLQMLYARHECGALTLNEQGREYIAREFAAEKVRSELLRRWEQIVLS
jgi:hypothetical protein